MATYTNPACGQSTNSTWELMDDLQIDRASDGTPRSRALFTAPKAVGSIEHESVTLAEKTVIANFYIANRLVKFTFVWAGDGASYTCIFSGPPKFKRLAGSYWQVTLNVVQAL